MEEENKSFRIFANKGYSIMSNHHLRNEELTLKAKGLLSLMLSLPPNWDYSIKGLCSLCLEKESAISSALVELKKQGYVMIEKILPSNSNGGRIEYIYKVFEQPNIFKKQDPYFQGVEIQGLENHPLVFEEGLFKEINSNNINNIYNVLKDNNTIKENKEFKEKKESKIEDISPSKVFIPPTLDEVTKYCEERKNGINPKQFINHYESSGWFRGKTKIKNWKACVRTWEENSKKSNQNKVKDWGDKY